MKAILNLVERYFDLMYTCDVEHFDRVFHRSAQLQAVAQNGYSVMTFDEYKRVLKERVSPASKGDPRDFEILMLDVTGEHTAMVKVSAKMNQAHYIDYLSLLKVDGEWLVVAKVYHVGPLA